ncbi:hypothetical protein F4815DRAFT_470602 [Daldinia loculata]|nr:hypothetical protein F4815DRAFT_470602 [Daldinia loculata]
MCSWMSLLAANRSKSLLICVTAFTSTSLQHQATRRFERSTCSYPSKDSPSDNLAKPRGNMFKIGSPSIPNMLYH